MNRSAGFWKSTSTLSHYGQIQQHEEGGHQFTWIIETFALSLHEVPQVQLVELVHYRGFFYTMFKVTRTETCIDVTKSHPDFQRRLPINGCMSCSWKVHGKQLPYGSRCVSGTCGQAEQLLFAPNSPWMKVLDSDQDEVLSDGRWVHSLDHIPSFDVALFFGRQRRLVVVMGPSGQR
jgi:hypothetical protein